MKVAIALIAALIIGLDATNADDAADASAEAKQILSSVQDQISQNIIGAAALVDDNLEEIEKVSEEDFQVAPRGRFKVSLL